MYGITLVYNLKVYYIIGLRKSQFRALLGMKKNPVKNKIKILIKNLPKLDKLSAVESLACGSVMLQSL